ncbi:hypothetical protein DFP72DRAFT_859513 [Ephemerocybe angulata]|uniref:Uncharacterized protein n=1 Tax=Ephemerocybe angulata TaxID=980116 RepID=A0A8H6LWC6_9AGAR|nr:hypothetical protein DFP72DRAFT_859513 [Tulosesus angulatus]
MYPATVRPSNLALCRQFRIGTTTPLYLPTYQETSTLNQAPLHLSNTLASGLLPNIAQYSMIFGTLPAVAHLLTWLVALANDYREFDSRASLGNLYDAREYVDEAVSAHERPLAIDILAPSDLDAPMWGTKEKNVQVKQDKGPLFYIHVGEKDTGSDIKGKITPAIVCPILANAPSQLKKPFKRWDIRVGCKIRSAEYVGVPMLPESVAAGGKSG